MAMEIPDLEDIVNWGKVSPALNKLMAADDNDSETIKLLKEWFQWFLDDKDLPAKTPNALHMRTLVHLIENKYEKKD